MQKKGLIGKLVINGTEVQINYKSPLVAAQGMQDVENFMQFYSVLQNTQGPEAALLNLNPVKFPAWLASKMAVDVTALNTQQEMEKFFAEQSENMQMDQMLLEQGAMGEQPQ